MHSYIATIGRNYSKSLTVLPEMRGIPMQPSLWSSFVGDVAEAFRVAIEKTRETDSYAWTGDTEFRIEVHYGRGTWDGVEEDSAMISVLSDQPITHLYSLREELTKLAGAYKQDSIALTIGESELC